MQTERSACPDRAGSYPYYVKTNYPDARILQIEYDDNEYEIKLSNRWEITFDSKMRVIDIDD